MKYNDTKQIYEALPSSYCLTLDSTATGSEFRAIEKRMHRYPSYVPVLIETRNLDWDQEIVLKDLTCFWEAGWTAPSLVPTELEAVLTHYKKEGFDGLFNSNLMFAAIDHISLNKLGTYYEVSMRELDPVIESYLLTELLVPSDDVHVRAPWTFYRNKSHK